MITLMIDGRGNEYRKFIDGISASEVRSVSLNPVPPGETPAPSGDGAQYETQGAIHTTVYLLNQKACRRCHDDKGDVLALIEVTMDNGSPSGAGSDMTRKAVAISLGAALAAAIVLAFAFRSLSAPAVPGDALNTANAEQPASPAPITNDGPDVGEIASALAHDIKNPLAGIGGAVQVLGEDLPEGDPRRQITDQVQAEVMRLDAMIRDIVHYARPPKLTLARIPLDAIVERAVSGMALETKKSGIDVNIVPSAQPVYVMADIDHLTMAVSAAIGHAVGTMSSGGTVTVTVSRGQGLAEVAVTEVGHTLPDGDMAVLFKPFVKGKRQPQAMKLAIGGNVVAAHGGSMTARSVPGEGTAFIIKIPMEEQGA